jgi:hypothetical protein
MKYTTLALAALAGLVTAVPSVSSNPLYSLLEAEAANLPKNCTYSEPCKRGCWKEQAAVDLCDCLPVCLGDAQGMEKQKKELVSSV